MNFIINWDRSLMSGIGGKKVLEALLTARARLIDTTDEPWSLRQQCQLLGVNRSNVYYQPVGESDENRLLMRLLDEQYTRTLFYGVLKMTAWLRSEGYTVIRCGVPTSPTSVWHEVLST